MKKSEREKFDAMMDFAKTKEIENGRFTKIGGFTVPT